MKQDPESIFFHAACNEAVDSSLRPIRQTVINRLADRFLDDATNEHISTKASELSDLFAAARAQAEKELGIHSQSALLQSRIVELVGKDPLWRTLVLDLVAQQKRWNDVWSRRYKFISDRFKSFLEKATSPDHPIAKAASTALATFTTILLAIAVPQKIDPNFYPNLIKPFVVEVQTKNELTSKISVEPDGSSVLHVKAEIDNPNLAVTVSPVVKPDALNVALRPTVGDASIKLSPEIRYPAEATQKSGQTASNPQALTLHISPAVEFPRFSTGSGDSGSMLTVSVQELKPQSPTLKQSSEQPKAATSEAAPTASPAGPLDKIEDDLAKLNKNLGTLGTDFQISEGPQSNLAGVQKALNGIHSSATNQGRTTVVEAMPNSVHSVVLQWLGEQLEPESCTLTFKVREIDTQKVHLSLLTQKCSSQKEVAEKLPKDLFPSAEVPVDLAHWVISVDETHRRWLVMHGATLRFTWQPTSTAGTRAVQRTQLIEERESQ